MRCLALAQAWQDVGGTVALAAAELPETLALRLAREQLGLHRLDVPVANEADAAATAQIAQQTGAVWVAVDGYRFKAEYLEALGRTGFRILSLDDMAHLDRYPVDLLLNQNLSARREHYRDKLSPHASLLLGPRYSLLRREFRLAHPKREPLAGRAPRVLISFGGSDPENCTEAVLRRLAQRTGAWEVQVLAGAANPHVAALRNFALRAPFPCSIHVNVGNVAALMARADVAITAGGSTVWELAAMRLPALIGAISEDQRLIGPALRRVGAFRAWTFAALMERDLGTEIEALLSSVHDFGGIDAEGARRVTEQLTRHHSLCESSP